MTPTVTEVSAFVARLEGGELDVDRLEAGAIAAAWRSISAANPAVFNGPVLLADHVGVEDGRLLARCRRTSYSTFMWLRARGFAGTGIRNIFGAAIVTSSDGAVLLGRMAPHTSNAGQIYFPCGTPDPDDVCGDEVDLEGSIERELVEETGLGNDVVRATDTRIVVEAGALVACLRRFESDLDAVALLDRCEAHLAAERRPELDRIMLVRSADELTDASPAYVHAALARPIQAAGR